MSDLTLKLLKQPTPQDARKWKVRLAKITKILVAEYGTPTLGNYRDPVREIFYIVLSAKTSEPLYQAANRRLWSRFPSLTAIAAARVSQIRSCVQSAGLAQKRTPQVKAIAKQLLKDLGRNPSRALRGFSADEAFNYLCSLPGVGPKSALCVMMYSLRFDVFPVDAHIRRVLGRIMGLSPRLSHPAAQAFFPGLVRGNDCKSLHITLLILGRTLCVSSSPKCHECPIRALCSRGVSEIRRRPLIERGQSQALVDNA